MNQGHYQSSTGHQIMNPINFCAEVQRYLHIERSYIEELLETKPHRYAGIVELGCDNLRLLSVAEKCKVSYIGIDSRHALRDLNRQRCQRANGIDARYICAEIETLTARVYKKFRDVAYPPFLAILPFNLIGNLRKPFELCHHILALDSEIVISSFNPTKKSAAVRSSYYNKCGLNGKLIELSAYGHVFYEPSREFTSISMYPDFLKAKLEAFGYVVNSTHQNDLYYFLHVAP